MKRKIIVAVLTATMCVSTLGVAAMTSAGAKTALQNNLYMEKSLTLGVGEQYCVIHKLCEPTPTRFTLTDKKIVESMGFDYYLWSGKTYIKGKNVGSSTLKISSYEDSTHNAYGECFITVKSAPSSIKLNTTSLTLGVGESFTLSESTNNGSYANSANLKWSSGNNNIVSVKKENSNKATISAKQVGTTYVTVKTYNGKTATCKVTVKNAPTSVKLSKTSLTLNKGTSYTISEATNSGSYANASNLKWSSSNSKVATVVKDGGNKATVKAVGKGTAYISIRTYNGKTATCKVTVK